METLYTLNLENNTFVADANGSFVMVTEGQIAKGDVIFDKNNFRKTFSVVSKISKNSVRTENTSAYFRTITNKQAEPIELCAMHIEAFVFRKK